MVKGPVNSDSMGNSNVYHNPYDTRNSPAMQKFRAENYMNSKDVLQAQLEKDMLNRLQDGYLRLPRGGLVYIVFAGKFLLYMITLPPFLLFYGVPKWLLQNQFPKVNKALKKLKEVFEKQIMQNLRQIRVFLSKGMHFTGQKFKALAQGVQKRLIPLQKLLSSVGKQLSKWKESIQEFRFQARHFFIYLPNRVAAQVKILLKSLEQKFENVKNPFQPLQNWFAEKGEVVESAFIRMTDKASEIINRLIVKPYQAVKNTLVKVQVKVLEKVQEVLQPPLNWVKEKYKAGVNIAKKITEKIAEKVVVKVKELVEPRLEKLREWSKSMVDSGEKVVQQASQVVQAAVQAVIVPAINLFAPLALVRTSAGKAFGRGKGLGKKILEKVSKVKNHLQSGSQRLFQVMKKGVSLLKKTVKRSYEILKTMPLKLWRFLLKVLAFIAELARRLAYVMHMIFTWTRVLFRYTLIRLRKNFAS